MQRKITIRTDMSDLASTPPAKASAAPRRKKKGGLARLWLLIHGWLALPIWAYLFFICVTGTIATISHELIWLADSSVRASRPAGIEERLGADALVAKVMEQRPENHLVNVVWPVEKHFAPTVTVSDPEGRQATLYVNPYDGRIQGQASTVGFRYFIRALHGWLFMPWTSGYSWGWYAVTILGIPMLGSLITGILVYKKFWRAYLNPRLRIGKGARIFWGDFHRLAGIWSLPFVLIISVTATWFLLQGILSDNGITVSTAGIPTVLPREALPEVASIAELPQPSFDAMIATAREANPGMKIDSIWMPSNAFSPIELYGRGSIPLFFESAQINPYDGELVKLRQLSDYTAIEMVTTSMYPLHFGDFMGVWLKVIYFIFGVLLCMMILSGMLIWTKRTARETSTYLRDRRDLKLEPAE